MSLPSKLEGPSSHLRHISGSGLTIYLLNVKPEAVSAAALRLRIIGGIGSLFLLKLTEILRKFNGIFV